MANWLKKYVVADTPKQQFTGLNRYGPEHMIFPVLDGDLDQRTFRGLDSGDAVHIMDSTGKEKILLGNQDTATFKGLVKEQRMQQGGSSSNRNVVNNAIRYNRLLNNGQLVAVDKGTNKIYFGNPNSLDSGEVLTGADAEHDIMAKGFGKDHGDDPRIKDDKVTPVGNYPLTYADNIYGMPGYRLEGSAPRNSNGIVALHYMYDPAHRGKLFDNGNDEDNYRSFGCVNNTKETQRKLIDLNFANKKVTIFNSKRSPDENIKYAKANEFINTLPDDKQEHAIDSFNHLYYPVPQNTFKTSKPTSSIPKPTASMPDNSLLEQAIKDGFSRYEAEQMIREGFKRSSNGSWRDYEFGGSVSKNRLDQYGDKGKQQILVGPNHTDTFSGVVKEKRMQQDGWLDKYKEGGTSGREVLTRQVVPLPPFVPYTDIQLRNMDANAQVVRQAPAPKGKVAKALDIARNPMTAIQSMNDRGSVPDNFNLGERNIYDNATDFVNPMTYIDAATRTLSAKHFRDMTDEKGKIDWNKLPDAIVKTGLDAGMVSGLSNEVKSSYFPNKGTAKFAESGFVNQHGAKWYNNKPELYDITPEGKPIVAKRTSGKSVTGNDPVYNNLSESTELSKEQIEQIKNAKMSPEDVKKLKDIKDNHNTFKGDLDEWDKYKESLPEYKPGKWELKPESQHLSDEAQGVTWDEDGPYIPKDYIQPTDADYIKTPAKGGIPNGTSYTTKSGKTYKYHNENLPDGHPITPSGLDDQIRMAEQYARPGYQQIGFDFEAPTNSSTNPLQYLSDQYKNQPQDNTPDDNEGYANIQTQQLQDSVAQPKPIIKRKLTKQDSQFITRESIQPKQDSVQPTKKVDTVLQYFHRHNLDPFIEDSVKQIPGKKFKDGGSTNDQTPRINQQIKMDDWLNRFPTQDEVMRQAPENMTLAHGAGRVQNRMNTYDDINNNYIQPIGMVNDMYMMAEGLSGMPKMLKGLTKASPEFIESNVAKHDSYSSINPNIRKAIPYDYSKPSIGGPLVKLTPENTPWLTYKRELTPQEEIWKSIKGDYWEDPRELMTDKKKNGGWLKKYL